MKHVPQPVDYGLAVKHYRKTADMKITGQWMQSAVSRASFNLGYMHQFGLGVTQDMPSAKRFYERCQQIDPDGAHLPLVAMFSLLDWHQYLLDLPPHEQLVDAYVNDLRVQLLVLSVS